LKSIGTTQMKSLKKIERNQEVIKEIMIATKKQKSQFQKHPKIFTWGFG